MEIDKENVVQAVVVMDTFTNNLNPLNINKLNESRGSTCAVAISSDSHIGANCVIGNNVVITGSYIMNNVVIKDNCRITNSYIDSNTVVGYGCVIDSGRASNVNINAGSEIQGSMIESSQDDKKNDKKLQKSDIREGSDIDSGSIISSNVNIKAESEIKGSLIEISQDDKENDKKLQKSTSESGTEWENDSKNKKVRSDNKLCYSSDSESE